MSWPHESHYPGYSLKYERTFFELVAALRRYELVRICVQGEPHAEHLRHQLDYYGIGADNIELHIIPTDDIWVCDCGPLVVVNDSGERAVARWSYNGWGERYAFGRDAQVPGRAAEILGLPLLEVETTLETGFEVNGQGSLLTTRSSVLNDNRNPGRSQRQVEADFEKYLGVTNTIWLTGMDGNDPELGPEETDCHIDLCCRFVNENTVLYGWPEHYDANDPAFRRVFDVYRSELSNARTESDKPLELVPVPTPRNPVYSTNAHGAVGRITAEGRGILGACGPNMWYSGYMDWHVANGIVLVPILGDENDTRALDIIREHFPGREVLGIDGRTIMEGGGGFHCITKAQPGAPA